MPYNFVADSFYTKKLCSRLSSSEVRFYTENGRFVFWSNVRWSSWAHCGLPISVNWTFSLGVTAEALRANIGSKSAISLQRGPVDQKFQVRGDRPTNHFSSQKTRLNDLSYGIKIWTDLSTVLSQFTRVTDGRTDGETDGRTDRILIARPRLHSMQRGKNQVNLDACTPLKCMPSPSSR